MTASLVGKTDPARSRAILNFGQSVTVVILVVSGDPWPFRRSQTHPNGQLGPYMTPRYPSLSMGSVVTPDFPCYLAEVKFTSRSKRMSRNQSEMVQLKLRFPERLRLRIESAANRNRRSMNAEINDRLEQSFQRHDQAALAEAAATAVIDKFVIAGGKLELKRPK